MTEQTNACTVHEPDYSNIEVITIEDKAEDYQIAMQKANLMAEEKLDDYRPLSWYDRDRDFESPQHSSECHADSAIPGYVITEFITVPV